VVVVVGFVKELQEDRQKCQIHYFLKVDLVLELLEVVHPMQRPKDLQQDL